ncbi:MAG: DUF108 domain-containing protein [Candidatus Omnitrophica bacterium]|nr:DUF108 domain-containing protein [Candidatus Omnitrophota bacterium]
MLNKKKVKIGIVGCGAIGEGVALFINKTLKHQAKLSALADMDELKAKKLSKKLRPNPQVCDIDNLIKKVDLIIEAASVDGARLVLSKALKYKKDVVILSVGALIKDFSLLQKIKRAKINIYLSSGAISGVDGLGALSLAKIKKVTLTTSKPPKGLIGADYLKDRNINLKKLKKEKVIFRGNVRQAIKHFPKNINVAATILISTAFKNVEVCIKADPKLKRNIHCIRVEAEEGNLDMSIQNAPSKINPKTSALAILSTQYLLKKLFSPFKIGS